MDKDNIDEEYERLRKELQSVEASLSRMRTSNQALKQQISEKGTEVSTQQAKIRNQDADIKKIGKQVSRMSWSDCIVAKSQIIYPSEVTPAIFWISLRTWCLTTRGERKLPI